MSTSDMSISTLGRDAINKDRTDTKADDTNIVERVASTPPCDAVSTTCSSAGSPRSSNETDVEGRSERQELCARDVHDALLASSWRKRLGCTKAEDWTARRMASCFAALARMQDARQVQSIRSADSLVEKAILLLLSCGCAVSDVCLVLAHANCYFTELVKKTSTMAPGEADHIAALLIFMAHAYVLDEHCTLRIWHKYLFSEYCSLQTLNKALIKMMVLRGYVLRVDDNHLRHRQVALATSIPRFARITPAALAESA
jgi:hypothetical protein